MPFIRVDPGMKDEFENSENAHYKWESAYFLNAQENAPEEQYSNIVIGVRHSYGGYQRAMKKYRKEGYDPSLMVAKETTIEMDTYDIPKDNRNQRPKPGSSFKSKFGKHGANDSGKYI